MKTTYMISNFRKIVVFSLLLLFVQLFLIRNSWSADYVASVSFSRGTVTAVNKNEKLSRLLRRGHKVRVGDIIKTESKSMVQLVFKDRSMLYIKENSIMEIEEFQYKSKNKKDSMVTSIAKGSVRALTGLIGKQNPEQVKFKSPVGTIGIRGTAIEITERKGGNAYEILVDFGKVSLSNSAGELFIEEEHSAFSGGMSILPEEIPYIRALNDVKNSAKCLVKAKTEEEYGGCKGLYKDIALEDALFMTAMENQVPGFMQDTLMMTLRGLIDTMSVADVAIVLTTSSQVYPELTPDLLTTAVKSKINISIALESVIRGMDQPTTESLDKIIITAIGLGLTHEDAMKVLEEVKNQGICR